MKKFNEKFGAIGWVLLIALICMGAKIGGNVLRIGDDTIANDKTILMGDGVLKWNGSTSKLQRSNDGGTIFTDLDAVAITDPSLFNAISSNSQAEIDVVGWVLYADAAGASPVDGIGGSPVITFSRETTAPLREIGSFKIVKDAVNRQGEGVAFDFTIEKADLGGEVTVRFEYTVSTNYADDDIGIFIFNKDTPGLITPLGKDVKDGSGIFTVSFTADAVDDDYRLIFHIASVNALAYDFTFDNVKVRKFDPESVGTHKDGRKFNFVSVRIDGSGTISVSREFGDWVDSLVDNGNGNYTVNIKAGVFSEIPICSITAEFGPSNAIICDFDNTTPVSVTVFRVLCLNTGGSGTDVQFMVQCHSPIN